jgi:hypothetical protein
MIYSTTFCPAISYSEIKFSLISSISLSNYSFIFRSYISLLPSIRKRLFLRFVCRRFAHSEAICNCLSLNILLIVTVSLQETFGRIGTSKYSPTKASICFLIRGINSTAVGYPIPKFSSKYLNYSLSRLQL